MEFAIMVWNSGNVRASSIFGVIDKANPGKLPSVSDRGHWADYKTIHERRFNDAEAAKRSIAQVGYYLMGGEVPFEEIEGGHPPEK
jgi:hypothetical protein